MAKDYMALIDPTGNVGIEEDLGALESDVHDCSIDLCQIGALIAAAQGMKASDDSRWDTWEVPETELKLIRHVKVWRNEMLDPRIKLANKMPVPVPRLTGEGFNCHCQRCEFSDTD